MGVYPNEARVQSLDTSAACITRDWAAARQRTLGNLIRQLMSYFLIALHHQHCTGLPGPHCPEGKQRKLVNDNSFLTLLSRTRTTRMSTSVDTSTLAPISCRLRSPKILFLTLLLLCSSPLLSIYIPAVCDPYCGHSLLGHSIGSISDSLSLKHSL